MKYLPFCLFVVLSLQCSSSSADQALRNIPYVTNGSTRQQLDLYLPKEDCKLHPLIIWIHGGGWTEGSKDNCPAAAGVSKGYAVASINYRYSQQVIYPAQIEDCKSAVRWLKAHATEYSIDSKIFGVWGGSSGGHLAAPFGKPGKPNSLMWVSISINPAICKVWWIGMVLLIFCIGEMNLWIVLETTLDVC